MPHAPTPTDQPPQSGGVNRAHGRALLQKLTFWGLHALSLILCLGIAGNHLTLLPDQTRALILAGAAALYFARHGVTLFYLMQRRVEWGEVLGLACFIASFEVGLTLLGGGILRSHPIPFDGLDILAIALLLFGSYLNTGSEVLRKWWKADPSHKGRCYTGGLFKYSMHINYFGDVVLFTGWALLTHVVWALGLPLAMGLMFAFFHIPPLDAYLSERYGAEFDAYAKRTRKLIPFLW